MYSKSIFLLFFLSLFFVGCTKEPLPQKPKVPEVKKNILVVTASAYTSCRRETDRTPFLAAWNNRLKPSVKSIAVSRDLLKLGLTNGTKVKISGLKGHYVVLDKMNKRWKKKIDIYMGCNVKRARKWGKRKVTIVWEEKPKK
jgi:3D (Asp-Asp-Asp) domain-containing protein